MIKDIKSQTEILHMGMHKNRVEMKEELRVLQEEIFPELAALHEARAKSENECTEMGKTQSHMMDRVAVLEESHECMAKEQKKIQDKWMDLENRSLRQNLRFVGIPEGVEIQFDSSKSCCWSYSELMTMEILV